MPPLKRLSPLSLESLSLQTYINLLKDETELIFHLRAYTPTKSVLMRKVCPEQLVRVLESQFNCGLHGILQDIVRQRIIDYMIKNFHTLMSECISLTKNCKSYQILSDQYANKDFCQPRPSTSGDEGGGSSTASVPAVRYNITNLKYLPIFQQLMIILNDDVKILDFSKNKDITESEEGTEICRVLWKIVGERCRSLEKLILTKDLTYSSTLNSVIVNGSKLTHLTLKRNVPNNIFLNLIGQHCPLLQELDVAGSEIINDFGIVCLLFSDPEQIFLKCWNRDKTVGSQVRRSLRVFPQPYYDRQIPDQPEPYARSSKSGGSNYLYLRKTFHEALRSGDCGDWERLPIATSLKKFRLENTKVKGDGASVVLESCPNIYSLGYLVFAAAGLKQVFGYEEEASTNMTEIFYRGPSDQKLLTIANCCPNLKTLFLGSNNPRTLHHKIFSNWKNLSYLTLENIVVESVISCLEVVGGQIKGLKLQCTDLNLPDIAELCPQLQSLILQKESPNQVIKYRGGGGQNVLSKLEHLEVASPHFSKACMEFVLTHAVKIVTIKILCIPKLMRSDLDTWFSNNPLNHLKSLIILKGPSMTLESTLYILKELPAITEIGISDLNIGDVSKSVEFKKLQSEVKKKEWDVNLIDFGGGGGADPEDRDFSKLQNLHWFYLTPNDGKKTDIAVDKSVHL
eukprot:TRINITY_DN12736_c0_g1_i3.p1 TRINITY_DN12736_c0_g1~~TRINITY_DN12736_c0_g1_i3.p1  ORF type:complete len:683 (+),score=146.77 TRINITY_DN12736_c0_g1_i3:113-2161(+)